MFTSAKEFIDCRNSENPIEQGRATNEGADNIVWQEIIENYPEYKKWVIHNKKISVKILELLATDTDENVRSAVASKRKISTEIIKNLSNDKSEKVRFALMCNKTLSKAQIQNIEVSDSDWLREKLTEQNIFKTI